MLRDATVATMAVPEIMTHRSAPTGEVLEAAADVYLEAFSQPPYGETPDDRAAFIDRVRRYAAREGFRLTIAGETTDVVGFGLAVIAVPGDWYREQLAAQLSRADADRWLGERCLEIVHLGVRPVAEGQGLGGRLLDMLVSQPDAPTGVLTVNPRAVRATRLYESRGWISVRDDVRIGDHGPMKLLGHDLQVSGRRPA